MRTHLRATLATRLWFVWCVFWAVLTTAVLSPCVVLHSMVRPGANTFKLWAGLWSRATLALCGIRVRVEGATDVPEPVVLAVNHQNGFDILVTGAGIPIPFVYGAKVELRRWPFIGWVLDRTACLFVDRSGPKQALRSMMEAADRIRDGASVLLFPEGGRSWTHGLLAFMRGPFLIAIQAGVPVVPVAIVGNTGVLDEKRRVAWPGVVRLVIGEPIATDGLARRDSEALGERVRTWMGERLAEAGPLEEPTPLDLS